MEDNVVINFFNIKIVLKAIVFKTNLCDFPH